MRPSSSRASRSWPSLGIRSSSPRARAHEPRIERLLELPAGTSVAAVTLAAPDRRELLYVRAKGVWLAPGRGRDLRDSGIEALLAACAGARRG